MACGSAGVLSAWFKKRRFDAETFVRTRACGSPSWQRASLVRPDTFAQTDQNHLQIHLANGAAHTFLKASTAPAAWA